MKNMILTGLVILFAVTGLTAQKSEIFAPDGKAIKGFDAVAFYQQHRSVQGLDRFCFQWKNAQWLFSSKANLDSFTLNPERYAPQYGGYCAYGTSRGYKAPTETNTWTIVNDKLYFNYNTKVKEQWVKDQQALIEKADTQWPLIKDK